ncbi:MAG: hypothetical protein WDW36_004041 [Sanguina aurantia]
MDGAARPSQSFSQPRSGPAPGMAQQRQHLQPPQQQQQQTPQRQHQAHHHHQQQQQQPPNQHFNQQLSQQQSPHLQQQQRQQPNQQQQQQQPHQLVPQQALMHARSAPAPTNLTEQTPAAECLRRLDAASTPAAGSQGAVSHLAAGRSASGPVGADPVTQRVNQIKAEMMAERNAAKLAESLRARGIDGAGSTGSAIPSPAATAAGVTAAPPSGAPPTALAPAMYAVPVGGGGAGARGGSSMLGGQQQDAAVTSPRSSLQRKASISAGGAPNQNQQQQTAQQQQQQQAQAQAQQAQLQQQLQQQQHQQQQQQLELQQLRHQRWQQSQTQQGQQLTPAASGRVSPDRPASSNSMAFAPPVSAFGQGGGGHSGDGWGAHTADDLDATGGARERMSPAGSAEPQRRSQDQPRMSQHPSRQSQQGVQQGHQHADSATSFRRRGEAADLSSGSSDDNTSSTAPAPGLSPSLHAGLHQANTPSLNASLSSFQGGVRRTSTPVPTTGGLSVSGVAGSGTSLQRVSDPAGGESQTLAQAQGGSRTRSGETGYHAAGPLRTGLPPTANQASVQRRVQANAMATATH